MIHNGDRNVNVYDIINKLSGKRYPTNDGVDEYREKEVHFQMPRDKRERYPFDVINGDETKPTDGDDLVQRVTRLENYMEDDKQIAGGNLIEFSNDEEPTE